MPTKSGLSPNVIGAWISVGAAILAAGLWLGRLDGRVAALENEQRYLHGAVTVPR
jgi:hypothetical protein